MEKQTIWEKLIEITEAKKDLEWELKEAKSDLSDLTEQNESLKKELLAENYKSYGIGNEGRLDFESFDFGMNNRHDLQMLGIKIEDMIAFIVDADEKMIKGDE